MALSAKNGLRDDEKDESGLINDAALTAKGNDDEASLNDALQANPFKRFFVRLLIKLKNHIAIIPLLMSIVCMIEITCNLYKHVSAFILLKNNQQNAFLFFCNVLLSIILVLVYLRVYSRKSSRKNVWIMSGLFYAVLALQIYLDIAHLQDIRIETGLYNAMNTVKDDPEHYYLLVSQYYTNLHIVLLGITAGCAILAPFLQPFTKKIHLRVK